MCVVLLVLPKLVSFDKAERNWRKFIVTYLTYLNPTTPSHNWGGDGGSGYWDRQLRLDKLM